MESKKNILAINGSASKYSANQKLVENIVELSHTMFHLTVFNKLKDLPHFDPELSVSNPPEPVMAFRQSVENANGIIICTPEYVFTIPSGLKNALEWCVATTVFSDKPVGLITASAQGRKAHEDLKLIMKTIMATFVDETTLLIEGVKGKINDLGQITDEKTKGDLTVFIEAFNNLVPSKVSM